jgi:hypothetical protein
MKFRSEDLQTDNAAETESDDEASMGEGVEPLFPKPNLADHQTEETTP